MHEPLRVQIGSTTIKQYGRFHFRNHDVYRGNQEIPSFRYWIKLENEDGDEDDIAWDMYAKSKPLPGQLENCEICDKRFTVTAYSKAGPDGGLLCTRCSKEKEAEKKKDAKPKKQAANRAKQRQVQSDLLDGIVRNGSKSLQEICVEVYACFA